KGPAVGGLRLRQPPGVAPPTAFFQYMTVLDPDRRIVRVPIEGLPIVARCEPPLPRISGPIGQSDDTRLSTSQTQLSHLSSHLNGNLPLTTIRIPVYL